MMPPRRPIARCFRLGAMLTVALAALLLALLAIAHAQAPGGRSLQTFLICYRWLRPEQAEAETTWWASHFDFFVCGSTDEHRDLLRRKTTRPMVRYLNVNNITRAEPSGQTAGHPDWDALLAWLDRERLPRERMFLHFAQDTALRPTNMPADHDGSAENAFLQVTDTAGQDLRAAAWSGKELLTLPGKAGETLTIGQDERFDTVNVELAQRGLSWRGSWQYRTAQGWRPLETADGTGGMQRSGALEFIPPADWVPTGGRWQLRLSGATTLQPPVVRRLTGRDFVTFEGGLYRVPGWRPAADADRDGYLSPAERAAAGDATARFEYESRVPVFWIGRYVTNIAHPQVAHWSGELAKLALARINPPYSGIFVDNGWFALPLDNLKEGGKTLEPSDDDAWQQGTIANLTAVKHAIGSRLLLLNTGNYTKPVYDKYLAECDGWLGEFWIRPSREFLPDHLSLVQQRDAQGKISLLHARTEPVGKDEARGKLLALALYYVCAGRQTYLFTGDNYGARPYDQASWFGALDTDLGDPLAPPTKLGDKTPTYLRRFERGLVVARPLPRWDSNLTDTVTVPLPAGTYHRLEVDGTRGETVSGQITVRNAEGMVLVR